MNTSSPKPDADAAQTHRVARPDRLLRWQLARRVSPIWLAAVGCFVPLHTLAQASVIVQTVVAGER